MTKETTMSHPEISTEVDPEAFVAWVNEYPRGALGFDLSKALAECVRSTQLHGRASTLQLAVKIQPGEGLADDLAVTAEVKSKPAAAPVPKVTFFATAEGGLSRRDPNQPAIPGMETT